MLKNALDCAPFTTVQHDHERILPDNSFHSAFSRQRSSGGDVIVVATSPGRGGISPLIMVDCLQVAAVAIVIFVVAVATEILFACCRLFTRIRRWTTGADDPSIVPPGKYRRGSISHSWSEASVQNSASFASVAAAASSSSPPERISTPHDELLSTIRDQDNSIATVAKIDTDQDAYAARREIRRASGARPNKLLFSADFTKSLEQDWQSGQFICLHCKVSLTGQRYIFHDERPYCKKCYEDLFANICDKCKIPITCDFKDLSYKEKHWHDKCFKCSGCSTSLIDQPFAYKNDLLYCAPCYENRFAARCTLCGNIFRAGMKKYEHKGRQWHAECFRCKICQKLIGTNSFIPRGQDVVCVPCYEKQFGQQCSKCKGTIARGGIIYRNSPWHRECFLCTGCSKQLAREKYTAVDNQPYCVGCYGRLFARRCVNCKLPITGVDDPKFIAFDGRQWHPGCFKCTKCLLGLIGRGFLTNGAEILCPGCCKE